MIERNNLVHLTENSIDIPTVLFRNSSFAFEQNCFCWYARNHHELVGIGPRLTEVLLNDYCFCKPDGMFFEETRDGWILKKFLEVKSGSLHKMTKKVFGFKSIIDLWRESPNTLITSFTQKFESADLETPDFISIPNDENIEVVFASHKIYKPSSPPEGIHFRLTFLQY